MRKHLPSILWPSLVVVVAGVFFHECLFRGFSLVPNDLVYQLMLPFTTSVPTVSVQNHFANDAVAIDYPWGVFWQETVKSGELPLWNPYILGGHPHLAESMPAVLSPFKLPYLVLPAERAFTLGIILEFILAGLFMFALLRELGRSCVASFIGAVAWMLNSGFLMWYWRAPNVFCWAPLVLLLLERSVRRQSWSDALLGGLTLGVAFLSGNVQAATHLIFLCGSYGLILMFVQPPGRRQLALVRAATVMVIGGLVAAVQWLPALELIVRDAYNSTQTRGIHASLKHTLLGPFCLVTLVFPSLTGTTESIDLLKLAGVTRMDFNGYIGLVPVTLFVIALCVRPDPRVRGVWWMLIAVLVILFLTPLVKYLYHRFLVVAVFAMSFAAAYGADVLLESRPEAVARIRRMLFAMTTLCALIAVGLLAAQIVSHVFREPLMSAARERVAEKAGAYAFRHRPDWFQQRVPLFFEHYRLTNVEFWLPLISVPIVTGIWFGCQRWRVPTVALPAALVLLSVADLTVLGRQLVPQIDLARYPLRPQSSTLSLLLNEKEMVRVHHWGPSDWYIFQPNWLMPFKIYDLWGNCSLSAETVERLPFHTNGQFNALLDLANVKYILTRDTDELLTNRFELALQAEGIRVYRNPHCLPRFQFFNRWEAVPDRLQMKARMLQDAFDPSQLVLLEQNPPITNSSSNSPSKINVEQYKSCRVLVRVDTSQPGILLLADTWYPGWKARLDGKATPLYRADLVLRAVAIPAGLHEVEFYFAPASFRIGAAVSLLTLAVAILFSGVTFHRRRNPKIPI